MSEITFGSVCSGIEAASVAWNPLGWKAAWLAEIEPAPCALLAYHYPNVPNLGNMLLIPAMLRNGDIPAPDVFTGGTPCQAFSIAGLRQSLGDARGNLSLTFCEIADEIDIQRAANGLPPCVIKWENVPGVLTTEDNAFGCFLAGLAGEDEALVPEPKPPAGKSGRFWRWNKKTGQHALSWPKSGCVIGPQRAVAWRVFDAQYFGLAQRRKRVFVVGSARKGFDPAAILFEFEGVRRDSAPSRSARQEVAGGFEIGPSSGRFTDVAPTLDCRAKTGPVQNQLGAGVIQPVLCYGGGNTSGSLDVAACLTAKGQRIDFEVETFAVQSVSLRGREGGAIAELGGDVAGTLRASGGGGDKAHVLAPTTFVAGDYKSGMFEGCDTARPLTTSADRTRAAPICVTGDITHTLRAEGFDASEDGTGRGQPIVAATLEASIGRSRGAGTPNGMLAHVGMAVRRLTPRECERLQGFEDDYTLIPTGKKLAADGPRYKQIGNSWAIPNVRWIGRRIDAQLRAQEAA